MAPTGHERIARASLAARRPLPEYVVGSKGGPWYTSHTYPTKVPPETIIPFIEASTEPAGVVADPFCGSGMTGVAALLVGRQAALSDLSPGAVHLARNHTRRVSPELLTDAVASLDRSWMRRTERDLYWSSVSTDDGVICGLGRHTVWSEVYECPSCESAVVLWDATAPDRPLPRRIRCHSCRRSFDRTRGAAIASVPRRMTVAPESGGKLVHGEPTASTLHRIDEVRRRPVTFWMPTTPIDPSREMYIRSALHLRGVRTVADMFSRRPALALSRLWYEISLVENMAVREALQFAFTNTAWHASRMRRYNARGGQRPLTGTLFIPQLVSEPNVFEVFRHQVRQVCRLYDVLPDGDVEVNQSSATDLRWLADGSADYVFTDPPFGNNIHYADCNIVWETWLGDPTDNDQEIVVNKSRRVEDGGKTVSDYQKQLTDSFREAKRVVATAGRVSVVFHNSDDAIWTALLEAVEDAGLHQAEVAILDKGQRSQKGYKARLGELVPFYDLVMTFSATERAGPRLNGSGDMALDAVTSHLERLNGNTSPQRRLEYLYSVAVSAVIGGGAKPVGLSLRAFEDLCNNHFERIGDAFFL
ncbi:MAG: DNA methyltransferase [bacterium]|nr:DNA methyltransferase [bacterium]